MTSPPRGGEGGSPKGDITLKADKVKEVTRGRGGGQKSQNGGDVINERPPCSTRVGNCKTRYTWAMVGE